MKKHFSKLVILAVLVVASSVSASAQVYVNVRPTYTHVVRPAPPSRAHIWVEEDWAYRGGRYEPVGGHWVMPPRPGSVWVPGRWVHARRGYQWMPGRWRRRY